MTLYDVEMTPSEWLNAVVPLIANLPRKMSELERYRSLLQAVRRLFPCDAVALLRLETTACCRWPSTA